ncbi:MAG: leucine-rich repeat protein [Ruminococcus sp.]|nr:leucine-rich repeat protein [Ruminococcus sp.]
MKNIKLRKIMCIMLSALMCCSFVAPELKTKPVLAAEISDIKQDNVKAEKLGGSYRTTLDSLNMEKDDELEVTVHGDAGDTIQVYFFYIDEKGNNASEIIGGLGGTVLDSNGEKTVNFTAPNNIDSLDVKIVYELSEPNIEVNVDHKQTPEIITSTSTTSTTTTAPTQTTSTTISTADTNVTDSGTCGENLTWTLDSEGTLTISGTGNMIVMDVVNCPWRGYRNLIKKVIINKGVTSIGVEAFFYCLSLESITIPDSVKSIGSDAFCSCQSLKSITIPASVTSIGGGVFYSCKSLESINVNESNKYYLSENGILFNKDKNTIVCFPAAKITNTYNIPDSVTSIYGKAFDGCTSLESITIPDSVTSIGDSAFSDCTNLKSITIPDSVTSIAGGAFHSCTSLKSITIPASVTSIGGSAFNNCTSLKSITIPASVTSIVDSTLFFNCESLESINVNENNKYYSSENGIIFNKDKNTILYFPAAKTTNTYNIPDSVTSIDGWAFSKCKSLKSIIIPDSVTSIGRSAFSYCTNLESISILNPKCEIYNDEYTISEQAVIKGYKGSTAEEYAKKYNRTFVALDNETPVTTISTTAIATTTTTKKATTTTTTTTVKATTKATTTTTTRAATTTTLLATTTTATTTQTTLPKDDIKEKFILKLMPLSSKTYETVADIKSITSTDNSVGVYVVSEDKRYLNITAANYGYAEITVELVNGDKYLVCLTVGYDTEYPETTTSTTAATTSASTTTTTSATTSTASSSTTTKASTAASTTTTAPITTTAIPAASTTSSTIVFNRDTDTWDFKNTGVQFWDGSKMLLLENELNQLDKIKKLYNNNIFNKALDEYINRHSGTCYGMTTLALIILSDKEYYLPLIQKEAEDIKSMELDENLKSVINYYSSLQLIPEIKYAMADFIINEKNDTARIKKLFEFIENGPVLVCYRVNADINGNYYSHAVIAYEAENYVPAQDEDTEFFDSLHYTQGSDTLKMIKVYDPNYLNYNGLTNIFVNAVEQDGNLRYYWGIKEHFAYNKKLNDKSILFVSNDTELLDHYGLFKDIENYDIYDFKKFYPELEVALNDNTIPGDKNYKIKLKYDIKDTISAPIEDDKPFVLLPNFYGEAPERLSENYILKYNNQSYDFKYDDAQYRKTVLKMHYAEILYNFDSELKAASFSPTSAVFKVKENARFTLDAVADKNNIPQGFYEIIISGISPVNGFIKCDYDSGLWHITSSVPLTNIDICATNGSDCINQNRSYSAKFNKITIQHSNQELTKIMVTETLADVETALLSGDVNNDGQINSIDASSVLAYYTKVSTNQDGGYSEEQKAAADVNGDGQINAVDASNILSYYAYVSTTKESVISLEEYLKS